MPKTPKSPRLPLTSHERMERMVKQQPKDDSSLTLPLPLNDPNGADDPAPAAIENDRGIQDRFGWMP